jgi:iron complex transport system substrate-binding protein
MFLLSRFKIQNKLGTQNQFHTIILVIGLCLATCSFISCSNKKTDSIVNIVSTTKYAQGFRVSSIGSSKLVEVVYPYQNATSGYKYLLVPKEETAPAYDEQTQVITVPIENIVCTSTTHIPLLDYIGETDKLIGFPTTDYISSEKTRRRIDAGKVKDIGNDKGMNLEILFMLKPSLVMGYTMSKDLGQLKKIQELGIPVVINSEYLEKHPLGRAEWIKFTALFFRKEKEADSVFNEIEKEYLMVQKLANETATKPTVLNGIVYGDAWFMPGGQNNASKLLKDAGCEYLWATDSTNGFLQLSFESVFAKAKEADLWIGVGSFKTLNEIKTTEERYTLFKPFRKKQIYTYGARMGAKGGSEFLELGYLRPDLVLKDLVKIAHPELLPDYQLYFHRKLD